MGVHVSFVKLDFIYWIMERSTQLDVLKEEQITAMKVRFEEME